ncbi:MAG: MCE family protein [Actinomycetota bacterium]
MSSSRKRLAVAAAMMCAPMLMTSCAFQGITSLPLPGTVGRGPGADTYHVELNSVSSLEPNAPVLIGDVVVGSIRRIDVDGWHADVEISLRHGVPVAGNATASVGQTSVLGSQHLALDPPLGQPAVGVLPPGATLALDRASTYPTTEQTLSSLAAVVNGGGLGQIGDVVHNANAALSGRAGEIRSLLQRLDTFVATLDAQRGNIVASLDALNRLASTLADENATVQRALTDIPPALDVLIRERPHLTTALDKLGAFSLTARSVVEQTQQDLVQNLRNLEPAIRALADVGPLLDTALAGATVFPYTQNLIDRGVKGDYINLFATFDLTVPRMKRTLFLGTRWGQPNAPLTPAPGDPPALNYTYEPLATPVAPTPPAAAGGAPAPQTEQPLLPVTPSSHGAAPAAPPTPAAAAPIFAGPYSGEHTGAGPEGQP